VKFKGTDIQGCFVIEPEPFVDDRGMFRRHFDANELNQHGIVSDVKQANVSENTNAFTLRGFHYQLPPHGEGKTLSCIKGKIYDIVVDLRPDSKTFLKWVSFELNGENRLLIHIPPGCANAFMTLEPNSIIHYYCSGNYVKESERGIRYNDPLFEFMWPREPEFISDKDKSWPDFVPNR
jgi:dTDP-4-dehydrorhamnose 3,5-epimerase